jgi:broad specificity phosphatase PhoE
VPIYVVRHAKAGDREMWTDDDALRPLTKPGRAQADGLIDLFADFDIAGVYSSPFLRCVQTVEPIARARTLSIKTSPALAEGAGLEAAMELMSAHDDSVFCTHGDIVAELLDELIAQRIIRADAAHVAKGSTWKVELKSGSLRKASYIPPP